MRHQPPLWFDGVVYRAIAFQSFLREFVVKTDEGIRGVAGRADISRTLLGEG